MQPHPLLYIFRLTNIDFAMFTIINRVNNIHISILSCSTSAFASWRMAGELQGNSVCPKLQ